MRWNVPESPLVSDDVKLKSSYPTDSSPSSVRAGTGDADAADWVVVFGGEGDTKGISSSITACQVYSHSFVRTLCDAPCDPSLHDSSIAVVAMISAGRPHDTLGEKSKGNVFGNVFPRTDIRRSCDAHNFLQIVKSYGHGWLCLYIHYTT